MTRAAPVSDPAATVVPFAPAHAPAFARLNLEWIEAWFEVEPRDRAILDRPREAVIDRGGEIFFVLEGATPVGTVAIVPESGGFELGKMAVTAAARGRGHGDLLLRSAVDWVRRRGGGRVTLHSNRTLRPALALYRKHGFREVEGVPTGWKRSDIAMVLDVGVDAGPASSGQEVP